MHNLNQLMADYLLFCEEQKELDPKTLKAYRIDLRQFQNIISNAPNPFSKPALEHFCRMLHKTYKPRTVKRKIASAKAFCHWLEYEEFVDRTPFARVHTKYREPVLLPRTIDSNTLTEVFRTAYQALKDEILDSRQYKNVLRDIAILELLYATGLRVSELSNLLDRDIDLMNGSVRVLGKGGKERIVQICNTDVLSVLSCYRQAFESNIKTCGYFFINRNGQRFSEQSIRSMIRIYEKKSGSPIHITPHMFRHTLATNLLDAGVDIRYIQEVLGHSSISITEIYTHVAGARQKQVLTAKHPRNQLSL